MAIQIRIVTTADLEELQKICRLTFAATFDQDNDPADLQKYLDEAYDIEVLSQELAQEQSAYFFALKNTQIVGYLKLNWGHAQSELDWPQALEIQRIYVHPEYQKQGIGQALFDFALKYAHDLACEGIWLGVWEHNKNALGFYRHLGFKQAGAHTFVLGNDRQTDLLMYRDI